MKFKIGSKVRIIKNDGNKYYDKYIGKVGYIGKIDQTGLCPYWVYSKPNEKGEFLKGWKASEIELVKTKKEKKAPECDCPGHKILISPNDCICSPDDAKDLSTCKRITKKEGKIERLRYLDKEVISPIIDILEKYDLKTNRGNLLALGRILIFILKKQRELNSLLDAFNSTQEEGKR